VENNVPDFLTDRFIIEYANRGKVELDEKSYELLKYVVAASQDYATECATLDFVHAFLNERAAILAEIWKEVNSYPNLNRVTAT
jgi:hypothetical protein